MGRKAEKRRQLSVMTRPGYKPPAKKTPRKSRSWRWENWRINVYQCSACRQVTTTVDVDVGVTPFLIGCPKCECSARSGFYPKSRPVPLGTPAISHEWYKPTKIKKTDVDYDHVQQGGLLMRPRTDAKPLSHEPKEVNKS